VMLFFDLEKARPRYYGKRPKKKRRCAQLGILSLILADSFEQQQIIHDDYNAVRNEKRNLHYGKNGATDLYRYVEISEFSYLKGDFNAICGYAQVAYRS